MPLIGHWSKAWPAAARIFDQGLFFVLTVVGQELAIHGKPIASYLFNGHDALTRPAPNPLTIQAVVLATAGIFVALRRVGWNGRRKLLLAALLAMLSPIAMVANDTPSALVFFLDMLFLALVAGVVWADSLLAEARGVRYWELLFDYAVRAAQLLIGVFTVLASVLQVISTMKKEPSMGFITTLAYPTMVIGLVLFFFGYWVMEPAWRRIGEHYGKAGQPATKRARPLKPAKR